MCVMVLRLRHGRGGLLMCVLLCVVKRVCNGAEAKAWAGVGGGVTDVCVAVL